MLIGRDKNKAARTKPNKLIRRTCLSGHESDSSGPKWHAPPSSESAPWPRPVFHSKRPKFRFVFRAKTAQNLKHFSFTSEGFRRFRSFQNEIHGKSPPKKREIEIHFG